MLPRGRLRLKHGEGPRPAGDSLDTEGPPAPRGTTPCSVARSYTRARRNRNVTCHWRGRGAGAEGNADQRCAALSVGNIHEADHLPHPTGANPCWVAGFRPYPVSLDGVLREYRWRQCAWLRSRTRPSGLFVSSGSRHSGRSSIDARGSCRGTSYFQLGHVLSERAQCAK